MYRIAERFISINGEGTRAGQLAVFVRFIGCNLSCSYCDTAWANLPNAKYHEQSAEEIIDFIKGSGVKNVTLTGGEPLIQPNIGKLLVRLSTDDSISVEIETNGSVSLKPFKEIGENISFTMDYKLPSSGMESRMNEENFGLIGRKDTVKFVSGSREDLKKALDIIRKYSLTDRCSVYISPVFGRIEPVEIVDFMLENKLNDVNLQLQMHKLIWDPDKKGV